MSAQEIIDKSVIDMYSAKVAEGLSDFNPVDSWYLAGYCAGYHNSRWPAFMAPEPDTGHVHAVAYEMGLSDGRGDALQHSSQG